MTQDFTDDEPTFLQEARAAMDTLAYPASTWTVLDVTCRAVKAMLMHLEAASAPPAATEPTCNCGRDGYKAPYHSDSCPVYQVWLADTEPASPPAPEGWARPASPECEHLWTPSHSAPEVLEICRMANCTAVRVLGLTYLRPSTQKAGG